MVDSKRKAMIFLALAFILAVLTAWLVINQVSQAQETLGQTVKVAVAKTDIQAYTDISPDMIDWVDMPQSTNLSTLIQDEKELEGHVSIVNLEKGDLFTANLVRSRIDIPADHRVVWLNPTENVILDQSVVEGDKIDIVASYKSGSGIVTKRILQNIPVVQSQDLKSGDDETKQALKVSLPVSQAELLIHMQNTAEQVRVLRLDQLPQEQKANEAQQPENSGTQEQTTKQQTENQAKESTSKKEDPKDAKQSNDKNDKKDENKDKKKDS